MAPTSSRQRVLRAEYAPIAQLVATPDHGNPPLTVAFDGSTSVDPDPSDSIASYTFSFGDGSRMSRKRPTSAYLQNTAAISSPP